MLVRGAACFSLLIATPVTAPLAQSLDPNTEIPVQLVAPPSYPDGFIQQLAFTGIRIKRLADWAGAPMCMENETPPRCNGKTWGLRTIHAGYDRAAWNADGSLLYLENGPSATPRYVVMDGASLKPKYPNVAPFKGCETWNSIRDDFKWNPNVLYKNILINVDSTPSSPKGSPSRLTWLDITTCSIATVRGKLMDAAIPDENVDGIGDREGNPSLDGRYVLLHNRVTRKARVVDMLPPTPGTCPSGATASGPFCFGPLTDISCGIGDRDYPRAECRIGHTSVSPGGGSVQPAKRAIVKYTVCSGPFDPMTGACVAPNFGDDYMRVYNVNTSTLTMAPRTTLPGVAASCDGVNEPDGQGYIKRLGHEDMMSNPWDPPVDYVIGERRRSCFPRSTPRVVMISLDTGVATPISMDSGGDEEQPHHVSARAYNRPGWVYVTYRPDVNCEGPGSACRHYQEVVAYKMSADRAIERYGHHRSNVKTGPSDDSEAQAVPRPDGQSILFRSAWNVMPGITCPGAPECGPSGQLKPYLLYKEGR